MSGPKTTRTRKSDARGSNDRIEAPEVAPAPSNAPFRRERAAEPAPVPVATHKRLDTDDLMALAQMDPRELAALMDASVRTKRHDVGSQVTGTITRVGRDDLFVDMGGKSEGMMDRAELPEAKVGDSVTAFVLSLEDGVVRLSGQLSGAAATGHLEEAREAGIPVEGKVISRNTGGFEVRIGTARAFCPVSRISRLPEVDLDAYVGQTLMFRVIETGDKVVLDRRVLQNQEIEAKAAELWERIQPGDAFRGTVRNVQPFGVFVDIGGVDGLIPRRELSWTGGDTSRVHVGQSLEVHVLEVHRDTRKLTLSARDLGDDPWNLVGDVFVTGGVYEGTVARVEQYGAFVELAEGLQGLVHVSRAPGGLPAVGATIRVRVNGVDNERRRLELSPATADEASPTGVTVKGTVAQVLKNGVVVQLDDGRTGWLDARDVDLPAGTVLAQRFRVGKNVTARVVEDKGDRVVLSSRTDTNEEDGAWRQHAAKERRAAASPSGFGTLGDLLGKLKLPK